MVSLAKPVSLAKRPIVAPVITVTVSADSAAGRFILGTKG